MESIKTGEPKGYANSSAARPKTEAEIRCDRLSADLASSQSENQALRNRIAELELRIQQLEGTPKPRQNLADAIMTDRIVNGNEVQAGNA